MFNRTNSSAKNILNTLRPGNIVDKRGFSVLAAAIDHNQYNEVSSILDNMSPETREKALAWKDANGCNLLSLAIKQYFDETVAVLKTKLTPHEFRSLCLEKNKNGFSVLADAVHEDEGRIIRWLLKNMDTTTRKKALAWKDKYGINLLYMATSRSDTSPAQLVLKSELTYSEYGLLDCNEMSDATSDDDSDSSDEDNCRYFRSGLSNHISKSLRRASINRTLSAFDIETVIELVTEAYICGESPDHLIEEYFSEENSDSSLEASLSEEDTEEDSEEDYVSDDSMETDDESTSKCSAEDENERESTLSIVMPPENSSGDIYHVAAYLFLLDNPTPDKVRILLFYDIDAKGDECTSTNISSGDQAHRSAAFLKAFGLDELLSRPIKIDLKGNNRPANRIFSVKKIMKDGAPNQFILQQATTTVIADRISREGTKATDRIRDGFRMRDPKYYSDDMHAHITAIVKRYIQEIKDHAGNNPVVVFHLRHSSHANECQNFKKSDLTSALIEHVKSKGYKVYCITADFRSQYSFTKLDEPRIDPFMQERFNGKDIGKLVHLELLLKLKEMPNLHGLIGNTSGTLDLAAFLGHKVYNIHEGNKVVDNKIPPQDARILTQKTFMTVDITKQADINNELKLATTASDPAKKGRIINKYLPSLDPWLEDKNRSQHVTQSGQKRKYGDKIFDTPATQGLFNRNVNRSVQGKIVTESLPLACKAATIARLAML